MQISVYKLLRLKSRYTEYGNYYTPITNCMQLSLRSYTYIYIYIYIYINRVQYTPYILSM